jgi:hypothetical protein
LALAGAARGDYKLTTTTATATAAVLQAVLTPSVTAANKVYDGTTAATIASSTLSGVLGHDQVSLTGGTAAFDTKDVGVDKTVTVTGLTVAGADVADYAPIAASLTTTASIRRAAEKDTVGLYDPSSGRWYLPGANASTAAVSQFTLGAASLDSSRKPLAGDWAGNGTATVGLYGPSDTSFHLYNANAAGAGSAGAFDFSSLSVPSTWIPLAGDWTGKGVDTIGLYDPQHAHFYLKNSNTAAGTDVISFGFESLGIPSTWIPLAGDWTGRGVDTIGLYDPQNAHFYLKNSNTSAGTDVISFGFEGLGVPSTWAPLAGDWTGKGMDTIGLYDPQHAHFYLNNVNSAAVSNVISFDLGTLGASAAWLPVTGTWDTATTVSPPPAASSKAAAVAAVPAAIVVATVPAPPTTVAGPSAKLVDAALAVPATSAPRRTTPSASVQAAALAALESSTSATPSSKKLTPTTAEIDAALARLMM